MISNILLHLKSSLSSKPWVSSSFSVLNGFWPSSSLDAQWIEPRPRVKHFEYAKFINLVKDLHMWGIPWYSRSRRQLLPRISVLRFSPGELVTVSMMQPLWSASLSNMTASPLSWFSNLVQIFVIQFLNCELRFGKSVINSLSMASLIPTRI